MKNIYDYGDKVSFFVDGVELIGTVEIIDRFGYFFDNSQPYYDIYIKSQNLLVKHVKESALKLYE